jgi:hypothetical protein
MTRAQGFAEGEPSPSAQMESIARAPNFIAEGSAMTAGIPVESVADLCVACCLTAVSDKAGQFSDNAASV